jgi:transcription initiation factor TFIIIB Brf1 subunit/transcription initiation factor TFIIB
MNIEEKISFIAPVKNNRKIKPDRSIMKDLEKYNFPEEVKIKADCIYNSMEPQVRRGKMRKKLLFYCLYHAYIELKIIVDPFVIGKKFDLTSTDIQTSYHTFSPLQTKYNPPTVNISPKDYIKNFCKELNISEHGEEEINSMIDSFLEKDPSLEEENPKTFASGVLMFYMKINGITTEQPGKIVEVTLRSMVTIQTIYKKISELDNK